MTIVSSLRLPLMFALFSVTACAAGERRFALRDPLTVDTDLRSVTLPCRRAPSEKDKDHVSCAPEPYVSPLIWDGADNLVFRPFAELWAFEATHEAANVNSFDEVADSAWFTNRLGARPMDADELLRGACTSSQLLLDTTNVPDGSWVIVVSTRRPAHPNWVSPAGHRTGRIWFRWFLPASTPERPEVEVVPVASV